MVYSLGAVQEIYTLESSMYISLQIIQLLTAEIVQVQ